MKDTKIPEYVTSVLKYRFLFFLKILKFKLCTRVNYIGLFKVAQFASKITVYFMGFP